MRKIEVCCSSLKEVLEAERAGAFRVELCSAIALGGITPSYGVIRSVVEAVTTIKVNVLIRVREGDIKNSCIRVIKRKPAKKR